MSDQIIVALIALIGTILGAIINSRATIISSRQKSTSEPARIHLPEGVEVKRRKNTSIAWMLGGGVGLIIGLVIGLFWFFSSNQTNVIAPTQTILTNTEVSSFALIVKGTETPTETITPTSTYTLTPTFTPTSTSTPILTFTPTNTFTPTPVVILDNNVPMVFVSSGVFNMYDRVKKIYVTILLPAFFIDQHEVTNGQYEECVNAGVCARPYVGEADKEFEHVEHFDDPAYKNYPVILVSYYRAKTYCEWRNNGTRLPTGEEWEKVARGKLVEQTYPWGNYPPSCELGALNGTNYSGCGSRDAFPVMSFAPNGYGLFDMSGNVSEWVDEGNKVIRGGSWNANESQIKVFSTSEGKTFDGYVNVGFRCARDAP